MGLCTSTTTTMRQRSPVRTSRANSCSGLRRRTVSPGFGVALGSALTRIEEQLRIDGFSIFANFKMKMGTGRTAARANGCNLIPRVDERADYGQELRAVRVTRSHAVSLIDRDGIAVPSFLAGGNNTALCNRANGSSRFRGNVDAGVEVVTNTERILSHRER